MYKEIGGYIELDTYHGKMLYDDALKLNCGRNALQYLIKTKGIKKMYIPKFMCNSNDAVLKKMNIECRYFSIDTQFRPIIEHRSEDEWLYIVNYYGQLSNVYIQSLGQNVIVDNAQAYFQEPISGYDTIYACRKFFGVTDGAIVYTDQKLEGLKRSESYEHMHFLLGRYERTASEFYSEYVSNNQRFWNEELKLMSKVTENLLHAIDYDFVKNTRTENFSYLHAKFRGINKLELTIPEGAFMYPLYIENCVEIRKQLQAKKIYVPVLWPDVFKLCNEDELEYNLAKNILPLPVDQRYRSKDMEYIVENIKDIIGTSCRTIE